MIHASEGKLYTKSFSLIQLGINVRYLLTIYFLPDLKENLGKNLAPSIAISTGFLSSMRWLGVPLSL